MPAKNGIDHEPPEPAGPHHLKVTRKSAGLIGLLAIGLGSGGTVLAASIKTGGAQAVTTATLTVRGDQFHEELAGLRGEVKELRDRTEAVRIEQAVLAANVRNLIEATGRLWVTAPMPTAAPTKPSPRNAVYLEHRDGGP